MPEADVLRIAANRLNQTLAGQELVRAELRWPSVGGVNLVGATVLGTRSLGKHLLTRLDTGQTLHTHLRMDGYWRYAPTGSREAVGASPQIRIVLAGQEWTALGWLLGMLDLVATSDERVLIGHLGPDILDPGFTDSTAPDGGVKEVLRRLYAGDTSRPICAALLDQRIAAGIGTIYLAESLFATRTWPWTAVSELSPQRAAAIYATAAGQIAQAVARSETSARRLDFRRMHGQHLKFCGRCNEPIAVGSLAGPNVAPDQGTGNRIVFYCPTCQAPASD